MNAVSLLEREWNPLAAGPLAPAYDSWRRRTPELRPFETPQQLLRYLHATRSSETDAPFHALLTLACDDRLAARVVLQAILPSLKDQSATIRHTPEQRDELWELLLFHAWEQTCCYPLHRRRRVVANLVISVLHHTTKELHQTGEELLDEPDEHADENPWGSDVERLLGEAVRAGALSEEDAELILLTRVDEVPLRLLVTFERGPYDALRKRRQRAERKFRTLVLQGNVPKQGEKELNKSGRSKSAGEPSLSAAPTSPGARRPHVGVAA